MSLSALDLLHRAVADAGFTFRLSGNGVWLADQVPPGYLERL